MTRSDGERLCSRNRPMWPATACSSAKVGSPSSVPPATGARDRATACRRIELGYLA